MKKKSIITLAAIILLFSAFLIDEIRSSDSSTDSPQKLYIVQLSLGENWDKTKEAHLQTGFQDHVANMKALRDAGKIMIGARYGDLGMLIIQANDSLEVVEMMKEDSMIVGKLFHAQINQFNPFYNGCTEIK